MLNTQQQRELQQQSGAVDAKNYYRTSCDTSANPVVVLRYNKTTHQYELQDKPQPTSRRATATTSRRRTRLSSSSGMDASFVDHIPAIFLSQNHRRFLDSSSFNEPVAETIEARLCQCAPSDVTSSSSSSSAAAVYCPVDAQYCKVTYNSEMINCAADVHDFWIRFVMPLLVFLFVFFGFLCFYSPKGRYSKAYCKKLLYRWSEEEYEQELQEELNRIIQRAHQRRLMEQQERVAGANNTRIRFGDGNLHAAVRATARPPNDSPQQRVADSHRYSTQISAILKTKKYQQTNNDTVEITCSICLQDVQHGDRVGDVRCGHLFHVDCLKSWLERKNTCPLCHATYLARPQLREPDDPDYYDDDDEENEQQATEQQEERVGQA